MSARERLREIQEKLGIHAKKALGQNFLVSDLVIERIIDAAKKLDPRALIEIGPGPGALTYFLRAMNVPLQLIELDTQIAEHWRQEGLPVLEEDALRVAWRDLVPTPGIVLVSNLPYQISSSLVMDRSMDELPLQGMVLMFQKEVAQRIRAQAKTDAYGLLSVIAQTFWNVDFVTEAGPKDFSPAPKVASRVLSFVPRQVSFQRRRSFLNFVKAAFAQRRKLLKSNLKDLCQQKKVPEESLLQWLQAMGFKETVRAEELSPGQFVELYSKFGFEE